MTQHTLPRHSTLIFWPGSILLMSTSTGAPAAFARSLGQKRHDERHARPRRHRCRRPRRSRRSGSGACLRRRWLTVAMRPPSPCLLRRSRSVQPRRVHKPSNYTGFARRVGSPASIIAMKSPAETRALRSPSSNSALRNARRIATAQEHAVRATSYNCAITRLRDSPCCASSGSSSRRPARCALRRCSSSRRCGRISCRA